METSRNWTLSEPPDSLQLEDMLLLLVVQCHLADGVLEADGDLAVVRDPLGGALLVLIEAHLLLVDHAVDVVPRPTGGKASSSIRTTCRSNRTPFRSTISTSW